MTDATKLRLGLEAYRDALARHLAGLTEHHAQMSSAWGRLREGYQGRGADSFGEVWQRSDARFREYMDASGRLTQIIEDQLDKLRRFDSPTQPDL